MNRALEICKARAEEARRNAASRPAPIPETPVKTLVRRDDPVTSHEAAQSIDATQLELQVLAAIRAYGYVGCISDELRRDHFKGYSYSSVTARYRALLDKGLIEIFGEPRRGDSGRRQRVMRVKK